MGKNGGINITELQELRKKLVEMNENSNQFIEACAKELAARLLVKVIERTPTGNYSKIIKVTAKRDSKKHKKGDVYEKSINPSGKVGGTLKRGWTAGQNQDVGMYVNSLKVSNTGDSYVIEIENPTEYAEYVEFGHRQTPGRFVPAIGKRLKKGWVKGRKMLTDSEKEIEEAAPAILEQKIRKQLGDYFK